MNRCDGTLLSAGGTGALAVRRTVPQRGGLYSAVQWEKNEKGQFTGKTVAGSERVHRNACKSRHRGVYRMA